MSKTEKYIHTINELIEVVRGTEMPRLIQKKNIIDRLLKLQQDLIKDIKLMEDLSIMKVDATKASLYDYPDSLTF